MSLFGKIRTLVGALVHKPFMPRAEKADLDEGRKEPQIAPGLETGTLEAQEPGVVDTGRVADLIAKEKGS
jgi:hypothetical protein